MADLRDGATTLVADLLADVPRVMYCLKDADGRYLEANAAFVARTNRRRPAEVVGCTAADLFPHALAAEYEAQDRTILRTGVAVRNQVEMISDAVGGEDWFLTTKVIHDGAHGRQVVVVSIPAPLPTHGVQGAGLRRVLRAVDDDAARPWQVAELAHIAGMGTDTLERLMRRVLSVSPKQYVIRARVRRAAHVLATTSASVADVAAASGFYDQSQLCRMFAAHTGLSPGAYRGTHAAAR